MICLCLNKILVVLNIQILQDIYLAVSDVCVYKGVAYKQGQQWDDGCEKTCVCENAAFGYYRCDNK